MTDFLNDWGLTLVVFVPLAGALVMMAVPAAEEQAHKKVALLSSLGALVMGRPAAAQLRLRRRRRAAVRGGGELGST